MHEHGFDSPAVTPADTGFRPTVFHSSPHSGSETLQQPEVIPSRVSNLVITKAVCMSHSRNALALGWHKSHAHEHLGLKGLRVSSCNQEQSLQWMRITLKLKVQIH